jgi:hypothetical protein
MARCTIRRLLRAATAATAAALTVMAVTLSSPAAQAAAPEPEGGAPAVNSPPPPDTVEPKQRDKVLAPGWRTSKDMAWTTSGDSTGLHILVAAAQDGYTWKTVASLAEPGFDTDLWIGNACLTGSGRRLVVVYAPRTFTNQPDLFDRGGFTAVVDLRTGVVKKLPVQSSLAYFNPGCGTGEKAVLSQFGGRRADDPAIRTLKSRLIMVDAAQGTLGKPLLLPTELSSPVPVGRAIVAAGTGRIVQVDGKGRMKGIVSTRGSAFHLAADRDGGVVFLDRDGDRARMRRTLPKPGARAKTLAEGGLTGLGLATGTGGQVFLTGTTASVTALPRSVRRVAVPHSAAVSTTGAVALTKVAWAGRADPRVPAETGGAPRDLDIEARSVARKTTLRFRVAPDPAESGAAAVSARNTHPALSTTPAKRSGLRALGSPTNPVEGTDERYCSVPRNDPRNQAMQPKPRQVEWAVDQVVTKSLTTTRPANWKNLGMPAYSPNAYFPPLDLVGGGRVPAQVMLGILAQESNMWQAPGFVLPGVTGNPLIGNFYGRDIYNADPGDDWTINWADADCGYGVAQVTDRMRLAGKEKPNEAPSHGYDVQRAVALDFVTNIAAGHQILQSKWNQVAGAGITVNNGDASKIENWFMAVWAYNSGFYPNLGDGQPWGVGWANNPINPRFDPQRKAFLDTTYEDARTPQKWPYPEKIMGWAGHPVEINESPTTLVRGYNAAWWPGGTVQGPLNRTAVKPPLDLFCDQSNHCVPGMQVKPDAPGMEEEPPGPCLHTDDRDRFDLRCWYHQSVQWKGGPGTTCATCGNESVRFDPGYEYQADGASYPPNCGTMPATWLVIDDQPNDVPPVRPDCPRTFSNAGALTWQFAADGSGHYPSKVDLHQIGGGFSGHFFFARTRTSTMQGGKLRISGTWQLTNAINGWYKVRVHTPDHRAFTRQADYVINLGDGRTRHRVIGQVRKSNTWAELGQFNFNGRGSVSLSTVTRDGIGEESIAWDAVSFERVNAPVAQYVAMGDSYAAGEGIDYYLPDSDHKRDGNDVNACHRSIRAYPYHVKLPGRSTTITQDVAAGNASFGFTACSGANTTSITETAVNSPPSTYDNARNTDWGRADHRFGELPQVDQGWLDAETSLVTLSIGGNDARFAEVMRGCMIVNPLEGCYGPNHRLTRNNGVVDPAPLFEFETLVIHSLLPDKLKAAYRAIHQKAPNATIVVVGYPQLFPDNPFTTCTSVGERTQRFLNNLSGMLSLTIAKAVAGVRAEGIPIRYADATDTWRDGAGNDSRWACPTAPPNTWTNMVIAVAEPWSGTERPGRGSFHPKEAGHVALGALATAALWAPSPLSAIAEHFESYAQSRGVEIEPAQAQEAARRCLLLTADGGVPGDPCMTLPVLFPTVNDSGDAAVNDDEGLTKNPVWVLLRRAGNTEMEKLKKRDWYTKPPFTPNQCRDPKPEGASCDEFPYFASELAATWDEFNGYGSPVSTNLKWVATGPNKREGVVLSAMYSACGVASASYDNVSKERTASGGRYLVVPLIVDSTPKTFYACPI